MAEEIKAEYIGPMKVFGLQREDFTTPSGAEVVRVLFESAPARIMPLTAYKALVTNEPMDYTSLGDKKKEIVLNAVVSMMMEYDATALEAEVMLLEISRRINNMFDRAAQIALTKEIYGKPQIETWTPGTNFSHYRTLLECDSVVRRAMKNDAEQPKTDGKTDTNG